MSKTFRELSESSVIYTNLKQFDWSESEPSIKKLGKSFGQEVGVFGINKDNKERFIFIDKDMKQANVKPGEYLVRMISLTSAVGGQAPLIKINPSKGLVWFLKDYEDEKSEFETKPTKMNYIRTSLK